MTDDEMFEILMFAPSTWQEAISRMSHSDLDRLESYLGALAQRAAGLCKYVEWMGMDQSHTSSAKAAKKAVIGTRKALVYSYPNQTAFNIPEGE